MPTGFRPLVIDNGSRDGSAQLATDLGATVVHAERRGYGAACHAGLIAATAPLIAVMDADASLDPCTAPRRDRLLWYVARRISWSAYAG